MISNGHTTFPLLPDHYRSVNSIWQRNVVGAFINTIKSPKLPKKSEQKIVVCGTKISLNCNVMVW